MNIADQIADILAENPTGLKASEIAVQIGCTRKAVNSYLYAHKDMYEQHDGYIWTAKAAKRNAPPSPHAKQPITTDSCSVSIQQSSGNTLVSTLTITPNGTGYQISSTNNQIICCDCNKFVSVHAPACPFCGCPVHYMADAYYKHYGAEAIRKAQRQQQEQQKAEELKRQQAEKKRKHDIAWECYLNNNKMRINWATFEKLCLLESQIFDSAIGRAKFLSENYSTYPRMSDEQWQELIMSDDLTYNKKLRKLAKDKQDELRLQEILKKAAEDEIKHNAIQAKDICKKNRISENTTDLLSAGQYTADEVQARIDAARYFARTYPNLVRLMPCNIFY